MPTKTFYERRNGGKLVEFSNRRIAQRRNGQEPASAEQRRRLATQIRRYEREAFRIPVRLKIEGNEVSGFTHDISPEGILVFTGIALRSGMPMSLRFSFGKDLC